MNTDKFVSFNGSADHKYEVGWDGTLPREQRVYWVAYNGTQVREYKTLDEALAYVDRAKLEDAWHAAGGHGGKR